MDGSFQLNTLIELVEKFIITAKQLLEKGVIDEKLYVEMTKNKIKFLNSNNINIDI